MVKTVISCAVIAAFTVTPALASSEISSPISFNAQKDSISSNVEINGNETLFQVLGGSQINVNSGDSGYFVLNNTNNGGPALLIIGSALKIDTGDFSIHSTQGGYGIALQGGQYTGGSNLEIHAKTITIDALGSGMAVNAGQFGGNFKLEATEHIQLRGTVGFRAHAANQNIGTAFIDAPSINIEGNIYSTGKNSIEIGSKDLTSTIELKGLIQDQSSDGSGITLNMNKDSVWNVTADSTLSNLKGTGRIRLGTAGGVDGIYNVDIDNASDPLSVGFNGLNSDDVTKAQDVVDWVEQHISVGDDAASSYTAHVDEGNINGAISVVKDGEDVSISPVQPNTKLSALSSVNATTMLQWRHEMNDLTKRMGELRMSPNGVGTWARLYGSEQEFGDQDVETKNASVQVGVDVDVAEGWKVGTAFSYTDSSSTMSNGEADGDMYGIALYGSWLRSDGQFLDLIAKYSRLSNDFTAGNMTGDYDNNAFSVSAEYGWHWKLNEMSFVEPQVEVTYGRIIGDDFKASNGVSVAQDDVDSLIGRVGLRGGFYFPNNKGTIYARVSALHDFDGETSFRASDGANVADYNEDLGGTWCEFGFGANFNLTDTTYTYVDLEKTTGGEVTENWRWNLGLRTVF